MHGSEADALIKWGRMTVTAGKSTWRESDLQKPTPLFMDEGTSAHQGCHFDTIIEMVWQYDSIGYYANYKPPQSSSYSS